MPFAPSTLAASYNDCGICFNEDKKISMEEPNCHTARIISTQIAVFVLPSQDMVQLMPTA